MTQTAPNPDDFQSNPHERTYNVVLDIKGELHLTVFADSLEQAKELAQDAADKVADGGEIDDLDEIVDVDVARVYKHPTMYFITRDGRNMSVPHLRPGDTPRPPSKYEMPTPTGAA